MGGLLTLSMQPENEPGEAPVNGQTRYRTNNEMKRIFSIHVDLEVACHSHFTGGISVKIRVENVYQIAIPDCNRLDDNPHTFVCRTREIGLVFTFILNGLFSST